MATSPNRRLRALAAGVVAAVAALGLFAGTAQASEQPSVTPSCPSLQNCYSYEAMPAFYDQVITTVEGFSRETYGNMPSPSYRFVATATRPATGCGPVDSTAYLYCPADAAVYVGQDLLWAFYSKLGDAAPAFGIAHEWGHHVQNVSGVLAGLKTRQNVIDSENQADCVAGAWVRNLSDSGRLEKGDARDLNRILRVIASAEGPDRDHGTHKERVAAAQRGFDSGMAACNTFFPDTPLV
jgi:predicted metalloprotease